VEIEWQTYGVVVAAIVPKGLACKEPRPKQHVVLGRTEHNHEVIMGANSTETDQKISGRPTCHAAMWAARWSGVGLVGPNLQGTYLVCCCSFFVHDISSWVRWE
jgi:hypothetical protein